MVGRDVAAADGMSPVSGARSRSRGPQAVTLTERARHAASRMPGIALTCIIVVG
jgi:hypothetical protein